MNGQAPNLLLGNLLERLRGGDGDLEQMYPLLRGFFALARGEGSNDPDGDVFLGRMSGQAQRAGVDPAVLRQALIGAIRHGEPQALLNDENVRTAVVAGAMQALKANGITATEEQVRDAVRLLVSGQAMSDIAEVGTIVMGAGRTWPRGVVADLLNLPETIRDLVSGALVRDVLTDLRTAGLTATQIDALLGDTFRGEVRSATLKRLYGRSETVRGAIGTADELLQNETLVLALVIYANMHGAQIDGETVAVVRKTVLDADPATLAAGGPDLGPLLVAGAQWARKRYGGRAPEMLRGLLGI